MIKHIMIALAVAALAAMLSAVAALGRLFRIRSLSDVVREAADGADEDAGLRGPHVCWRCGTPIKVSAGEDRAGDVLCFDCWSRETAPDDCPAVPEYVHRASLIS